MLEDVLVLFTGVVLGFIVGLMLFLSPSASEVIEHYQLCIESGASVEYCENI